MNLTNRLASVEEATSEDGVAEVVTFCFFDELLSLIVTSILSASRSFLFTIFGQDNGG